MTKVCRILVVDDEPDITEMYQMLLEMHGYLVSTANNGVEALDRVSEAEPDLILSDCMMPKMDGIEFIRRARQIPELASIPIILMSGHHSGMTSATDSIRFFCKSRFYSPKYFFRSTRYWKNIRVEIAHLFCRHSHQNKV